MVIRKSLLAAAAVLLAVACSPSPSGQVAVVAASGSPGGLPLPTKREPVNYYPSDDGSCMDGYYAVADFVPLNSKSPGFEACVKDRQPPRLLPPPSDRAYWIRAERLQNEGDPNPLLDATDPKPVP